MCVLFVWDFVRACLVVASVLLSIHIKHIQGAMVIPLTSPPLNFQKWIEWSIDHLNCLTWGNHNYSRPIQENHFLMSAYYMALPTLVYLLASNNFTPFDSSKGLFLVAIGHALNVGIVEGFFWVLELSIKSPRLWACFHPLSFLSRVFAK